MTREHNILFRAHVPSLVTALEDADSGVRDTAKTTIIEIFQCVAIYPLVFRRIH
jgi:CLIP-associating protein 1/2